MIDMIKKIIEILLEYKLVVSHSGNETTYVLTKQSVYGTKR